MTTADTTRESTHPRPHASVETAFLPPDVVLFDDRHGEIHHLNASASAVWLMLDGDLSVDGVAAELSEIFSVPPDQIRPDVESAIEDFRRLGLLDGAARADDAADVTAETDGPAADTGVDAEADASPRLEIIGRPPDT